MINVRARLVFNVSYLSIITPPLCQIGRRGRGCRATVYFIDLHIATDASILAHVAIAAIDQCVRAELVSVAIPTTRLYMQSVELHAVELRFALSDSARWQNIPLPSHLFPANNYGNHGYRLVSHIGGLWCMAACARWADMTHMFE